MKWIKDSEGDYLNLKNAIRVFIEDLGPDYQKRYQVIVTMVKKENYRICSYRTFLEANKFLEGLFEKNEDCD